MKNPMYMKDATGFCYAYTDTLSKQAKLTPYDGDVDENGFATDKVKVATPAKSTKKEKAAVAEAPAAPAEAPAPDGAVDPLEAALADTKLD